MVSKSIEQKRKNANTFRAIRALINDQRKVVDRASKVAGKVAIKLLLSAMKKVFNLSHISKAELQMLGTTIKNTNFSAEVRATEKGLKITTYSRRKTLLGKRFGLQGEWGDVNSVEVKKGKRVKIGNKNAGEMSFFKLKPGSSNFAQKGFLLSYWEANRPMNTWNNSVKWRKRKDFKNKYNKEKSFLGYTKKSKTKKYLSVVYKDQSTYGRAGARRHPKPPKRGMEKVLTPVNTVSFGQLLNIFMNSNDFKKERDSFLNDMAISVFNAWIVEIDKQMSIYANSGRVAVRIQKLDSYLNGD